MSRTDERMPPAAVHVEQNGIGVVEGGRIFGQSLAILEYLEETHPDPPLLPSNPAERARVRQLALVIACEVHPLQNSGVRRHLRSAHGFDDDFVAPFQLEARGVGWPLDDGRHRIGFDAPHRV